MSQKQYYAKIKREIIRAGMKPTKARWDEAGNCTICRETGRCPSWHTPKEAVGLSMVCGAVCCPAVLAVAAEGRE